MWIVTGCDENLGLVGLVEVAVEFVVVDVINNLQKESGSKAILVIPTKINRTLVPENFIFSLIKH